MNLCAASLCGALFGMQRLSINMCAPSSGNTYLYLPLPFDSFHRIAASPLQTMPIHTSPFRNLVFGLSESKARICGSQLFTTGLAFASDSLLISLIGNPSDASAHETISRLSSSATMRRLYLPLKTSL